MKEGVKKSISLILVLTLLVQLLPVVAFGVGDETNDLDISTDSETVSMKDDDAEIVGEEDALREESVKHFRLRDGAYMLVEYETAVHYQTADGSWEEIDNTLQKTGQQYVAQAGDMTRKFAASLDSGFLFETAYQGQSVSMSRRTFRQRRKRQPPKKQRRRRLPTSRRRRSRRRQTFSEHPRKPRRRRMRRSRRRQRSCRCWTTRRIRWSRPRRRPGWKTRGPKCAPSASWRRKTRSSRRKSAPALRSTT